MEKQIEEIRKKIKQACEDSNRNPDAVKILAVSKTKSTTLIRQAYSHKLKEFGENYVQEAKDKFEELSDIKDISWHFIGHLQSNKAKYAVRIFDLIHCVDKIKLAKIIDNEACKIKKTQKILVQVNIAKELDKSGALPEEIENLIKEIIRCKNLSLEGLMLIPPFIKDKSKIKEYFRDLRELKNKLNKDLGLEMQELSMGMSYDYDVAISEGATIVRIGTDIFGARQIKNS